MHLEKEITSNNPVTSRATKALPSRWTSGEGKQSAGATLNIQLPTFNKEGRELIEGHI
jgi:hypothetical protein